MHRIRASLPFLLLLAGAACAEVPEQPACQTDRVQDASRVEWASLRRAQADSMDRARRKGTAAYEAAATRAAARLNAYRAEHERRLAAAARVDSVLACREPAQTS